MKSPPSLPPRCLLPQLPSALSQSPEPLLDEGGGAGTWSTREDGLSAGAGRRVAPPRHTCGRREGQGRHMASTEAPGSKPSPLHKLFDRAGWGRQRCCGSV